MYPICCRKHHWNNQDWCIYFIVTRTTVSSLNANILFNLRLQSFWSDLYKRQSESDFVLSALILHSNKVLRNFRRWLLNQSTIHLILSLIFPSGINSFTGTSKKNGTTFSKLTWAILCYVPSLNSCMSTPLTYFNTYNLNKMIGNVWIKSIDLIYGWI